MSDSFYLVAFGLIERDGSRAMPLGGKSLPLTSEADFFPDQKAKEISLELLLRIIQMSEKESLKIVSGNQSIIMAKIQIENMQKEIPLLKNQWISTGDNDKFLKELNGICSSLWRVNFIRYEGIKFSKISF